MHFSDNSPLVLLLHHLANHGDSLLSAGGHSRLIELGENLDFVSHFHTHVKHRRQNVPPFLNKSGFLSSTYLRFKAHQVSSRSLVVLVSHLVDPTEL